MHGLGNDYIYFDCIKNPTLIKDPQASAIKLSKRHFSIGGDGIVLILTHPKADFQMRMFNADGSEAEMCGNAIRCVAKFVYDKGYTTATTLTIATGAGILTLQLTIQNKQVQSVCVDMGEPILSPRQIPVVLDTDKVISHPITTSDGSKYKITCVSLGNPHAVIFIPKISDYHIHTHGKELEINPLFPKRINVEFARIISRTKIEMRVWERGSGETLACGTGATATAVAAVLNNLTDKKVTIKLLGGELQIEWATNNHLYMTGSATIAFEGVVDL